MDTLRLPRLRAGFVTVEARSCFRIVERRAAAPRGQTAFDVDERLDPIGGACGAVLLTQPGADRRRRACV